MANTVIQLKKSGTPSAAPTNLANGELAINYADGKLFYKSATGTISEISGAGSDSFGTVNANGTLIVSGTPGGVFSLIPGNNITVVGDAINDKITIGLTDEVTIPGVLYVKAVGGSEGGQIELANAVSGSTLAGNVVIDIYENKLRFYEKDSPNKGAYIDLSAAASGVGSDLLAGGGGTTDTVARSTANAAFDQANAASSTAASGYDQANSANLVAVSAYNAANLANSTAVSAYELSNTNNVTVTASFSKANDSYTIAVAAFNKANTESDAKANVGEVAPSTPSSGTLWWNSNTGKLLIYYTDTDTSQWVEATSIGGTSVVSGGSANIAPAFDQANLAFQQANAAYNNANTTLAVAIAAFDNANATLAVAVAAFEKANSFGTAVAASLIFGG